MNQEIRLAIIEDAEAILTLQRLAYQSEAAIYDDFTIPPLTETLEDLTARFHDRRFLKAVENDQIVGSVRAFQDKSSCHVERLIVHPEYRRRGVGTALLNRIETLFPTAQRFELFTGHKSEINIRLYERVGYRTFRQERVNEKVSLVFMEKTFRVREFHPGDEAAFRRLNEEWLTKYFCIEEEDRNVLSDPCQYILATGGVIFMVEFDGEPVGCCALIPKDNETLEIGKMAVTEPHQGKGLGKLLLQTCIEKAKSLGKKRLVLETNGVLGTAVALYRKFGFIELGPDAAPPSAYARTEMFMELRLSW
jgi:GNAT superfamily N-acetyltransferase